MFSNLFKLEKLIISFTHVDPFVSYTLVLHLLFSFCWKIPYVEQELRKLQWFVNISTMKLNHLNTNRILSPASLVYNLFNRFLILFLQNRSHGNETWVRLRNKPSVICQRLLLWKMHFVKLGFVFKTSYGIAITNRE